MSEPLGHHKKGGSPAWTFDMQAQFPIMWTTKAFELHRMVGLGMDAIREDFALLKESAESDIAPPIQPSLFDVTLFLAALAIENLLKGVLVFTHPEYVKEGKLCGPVIGTHDLVNIARDARFALNDEELEFCAIGSDAIQSFGRYHIGKSINHTTTQRTFKFRIFDVYSVLYEKLNDNIRKNPVPRKGTPPQVPPND